MENNCNSPINLGDLVAELGNHFDNIAAVKISHPLLGVHKKSNLHIDIEVVTGDADLNQGQGSTLRDDIVPESMVEITTEYANPLQLPFTIRVVSSGQQDVNTIVATTIFLSDNVHGTESLSLDEGISNLKAKFSGICPSCGTEIGTYKLREHLRDFHTPEVCQQLSD